MKKKLVIVAIAAVTVHQQEGGKRVDFESTPEIRCLQKLKA